MCNTISFFKVVTYCDLLKKHTLKKKQVFKKQSFVLSNILSNKQSCLILKNIFLKKALHHEIQFTTKIEKNKKDKQQKNKKNALQENSNTMVAIPILYKTNKSINTFIKTKENSFKNIKKLIKQSDFTFLKKVNNNLLLKKKLTSDVVNSCCFFECDFFKKKHIISPEEKSNQTPKGLASHIRGLASLKKNQILFGVVPLYKKAFNFVNFNSYKVFIKKDNFIKKSNTCDVNHFSIKQALKLNNNFDLKKKIKLYDLETYHRSNQDTCLIHKAAVKEGDWIQTGDLLADCASSVGGELAIGHNIIVAYMPWEGYNYEDAILINERLVYEDIYTSIHIERYEVLTKDTNNNMSEQITREIPDISENEISHLDKNGIAKIGSWVEEGDILVGKVTPFNIKTLTPQQKLLYKIFDKELSKTKDSSLRAPRGIKANVININILARQKIDIKTNNAHDITFYKKTPLKKKESMSHSQKQELIKKTNDNNNQREIKVFNKLEGFLIKHVHIYLAEKRKIQVGDKMAGRHGNKGIISRILPRQDMPFLPDGTCIDIVLNPLGVPSRMNVGQIYECLLGLAGLYLGEHYKIPPFDEKYGADASRSFVLSKLYDARNKTGLKWLLDPNNPGKMRIFDGRTSEGFHQTVTVGIAYVLKLVHMVDDKLHMRSTGPYSLVTQQPLRGRSKQGGQRLGEMEVWAIEGYGAAFVLSEMLTIKSDDMAGRQNLWKNLIEHNNISLGSPESFKVLVCELQALCLDIGLFRKNKIKQENFSESKTNSAPNLIEIDSLLHLA